MHEQCCDEHWGRGRGSRFRHWRSRSASRSFSRSGPLLERIALAKPNARSSHTVPTPQGGGIAVIAATIIAAAGALYLSARPFPLPASLLLSLPP